MELFQDGKELLSPVWTHLTKAKIVKGKGIYLYDEDNNKYIDFTSGIGVVNTGHCHPKVVTRIQEQSTELLFGQMNCVIPFVTIELVEKLNKITPDNGKPDGDTCGKVLQECLKRNLLLLSCGTFKNIIRWIPPLIVTESQIADAVAIFEESLNSVLS